MKKIIAITSVVLSLMLASPVWAGLNEGAAAYKRGNYSTALREFRPLAQQGDAVAQYILGVMYQFGRGVPRDYAQAVKWYRKAAQQGDAGAQHNLGVSYDNGRGVLRDDARALMWFSLAASQGHTNGTKYPGIIAERMTPADLSKALKLAREWWAKHGKK